MAAQVTWTGCGAFGNAVADYFTANNYENAKQVLNGAIVGLSLAVPLGIEQYFLNAKFDEVTNNGRNDVCGQADPVTFTGNAASAVYEFCLAIQAEQQDQATTNYDTIDSSTEDSVTPNGQEGLAKFFVAQQAAVWGHVCDDFGVSWKG